MSKVRDLRQRLGGLLSQAVTLATGRGQSPDLSVFLLGAAERAAIEQPAGITIPNVFVVAAGEVPETVARSAAERHLEDRVTEAAIHRGTRFEGPITVTLAPGGTQPEVETAFESGPLPPWAALTAVGDGTPMTVHHNRALIGRSKDGDVVINENGVSRTHALLWREAGRVWIADLQSANGTFVNDDPVYEVVEVLPADVIVFGNAGFVFGMA
ncbi:MAG: FHA domain-containing protein [Acidimicrobiia bacterium]|nr:FHA domain-containing protein [Acidimicrobiia bacterium]